MFLFRFDSADLIDRVTVFFEEAESHIEVLREKTPAG